MKQCHETKINYMKQGFISQRQSRGSLFYNFSLCICILFWLKLLEQVLYLKYYLTYIHQTCMDGASEPTNALDTLNLGYEFQMLEFVRLFGEG